MPTGQETMRRKIAKSKQKRKEEKQKANPKYKRIKDRQGKVYVVSSTDGGKTWSKPEPYTSKEYKTGFLGRPLQKKKKKLKVELKSINKTDYNVATESGKKAYEKAVTENKNKNKSINESISEDDDDRADRQEEGIFRNSTSVKQAKEKHAKIARDKANKEGRKKAEGATTTGGPVKSGVEYARSKGDDLAGYRRGPNKALGKDTRITKHLKKAGWTEDQLAAKRKAHAEWKAARKNRNKLKKTKGG